VQLPAALRLAIEREAAQVSGLSAAAKLISEAYRAGAPPRLDNDAACAAYAATRLPATFAAAHRVLREAPDGIASICDLGAGAGAASFAAGELWPGAAITLVEKSAALLDWSRRLGPAGWTRMRADLASVEVPEADLVLFSYSLGELRDPAAVLKRAWRAARRALVVIEPGTRAGFATVYAAREQLRDFVAAPCPQRGGCPMQSAGDWCHFPARVERTALHRRLKEGELGHEDEKFSYVLFSKTPLAMAESRIVRHPGHAAGRIELSLCTSGGTLWTSRVTKRDAAGWRGARKAEWGDGWRAEPRVEPAE
jgi:ribosomal protein RSM22 (predicted rRNA methylase)